MLWRAPAASLLLLILAGVGCDHARTVRIPLEGRTLEALYWESSKLLSPSVLLVAPPGQGKESWLLLGARLREQGYGVLALEVSGGEASLDQLRAAFEYLRLQKKVDAARIGLVGADQGANAALEFAAREPMVRALILLSPTLEEPKSSARAALRYYGFRPILLAAAEEYPLGAAAVWRLGEVGQGDTKALLYSGLGVPGSRLLEEYPGLESEIVGFLGKHL